MYSSNGVSFNGGDTERPALSGLRQLQWPDVAQGKPNAIGILRGFGASWLSQLAMLPESWPQSPELPDGMQDTAKWHQQQSIPTA